MAYNLRYLKKGRVFFYLQQSKDLKQARSNTYENNPPKFAQDANFMTNRQSQGEP